MFYENLVELVEFINFLYIFRTTVSVIVISSLLLYKALVAQEETDSKNTEKLSNDVKIQKLEKRVRELESLLNRFVLQKRMKIFDI